MNNRIQYRRDIDGLRALAVLSVIFFHINSEWLTGGFLGVDMFFVISGYLITLILTKEIVQTQKINIINFYKRRLKRIVPALLFVLLATLITALLLLTPDKLLEFSTSMVWSFFSAANIYFFNSLDTSYFATGSNEVPLLHLWSLGVEEQFYLIWPFLLLLIFRYIKSIKMKIILVVFLFISSLTFAYLYIGINHSFTYYMIFTRAWELLAGAMVALLVHSEFRLKKTTSEFLALISFSVIIVSLILVKESDPVPGLASLPIILATALLIFSGTSHHSLIARLLSFKGFVFIGLLSYSAYLWHWPILAFLHYALVDIDLKVTLLVVFSTFIMATISYKFIESPLRKNKMSTSRVYIFYLIFPAIVITAFSLFISHSIEKKKSFIFPWKKLEKINRNTLPASAYKYNCQSALFDKKLYSEERCVYPQYEKKANTFLIGDSNAAHYLGMLRVLSDHYGFILRNATQSACPMVFNNNFDWIMSKYKKGCSIYTHSLKDEISKYDTVIVGGAWDFYYNKKDFNNSFTATIKELSEQTKLVILLAKVPYFRNFNKECEVRSLRLPYLECSKKFEHKKVDLTANKFLRNLADNYDNVVYLDIDNQLCKGEICSPYVDGVPVYFNSTHLSMKGSEFLGKRILETNDPILNIFKNLDTQKRKLRTTLQVKEDKDMVSFIVKPKSRNVNIAFYLYKDNKRVDTQWYSKKFTYQLDKKKNLQGEYRIRYFIVNDRIKKPGKEKKIEQGFSEYIEIVK